MEWDAKLYHENSALQYHIGEAAIERLNPREGEHILEIGCGPGDLTLLIAQKIYPGSLTAIDSSQNMIDQANANLAKSGLKNVKFTHMDAMAISFDAEFDAIFSNQAIHWIPTQWSLYKKMYKILKPRGRIILTTKDDPAEPRESKENGDTSASVDTSAIEAAALNTVSHTPELEQLSQFLNDPLIMHEP